MTADALYRPADTVDVSGIQDVAAAAWHAAYDDILGEDVVDEMMDEWYEDDAIVSGVEHTAQDFFVAVVDDEVVGYAHVGPHPPRRVHQLYRLYVHPDHWREGIARNLLAEVEQALYDRDVSAYEAEVFVENERAVAFYESTGFEQVDETETELKGVTAAQYIFQKRL
ncbi:GNAT family N-acetyltransferase [Halosimplex salinum]|uniref:GNAT family N-acetyltransferase n=1 Tax=Halosimplex salinum TaxID=1710538 RepID=UPI000F464F0F|nr:GNAT family N-acetyltransferase [Halosimplex salinum]